MADIDDRWLDVDFRQEPEFVFGDKGVGLCGSAFGVYEEKYGVMSPAEIESAIDQMEATRTGCQWLVKWILDQGQEGACVGFATTAAQLILQAAQNGLDKVIPMSPISMYKQIGKSPDSGAYVSDALEKLQDVGFLPLDTPENRRAFGDRVMPERGFYSPWPNGWRSTAALFKGFECDIIRSVAGIKSALCRQYPVVVGRDEHSVCYATLKRNKGSHVATYVNSWGDWGAAEGHRKYGFGYDSESRIKESARWAFAIRAVLSPV